MLRWGSKTPTPIVRLASARAGQPAHRVWALRGAAGTKTVLTVLVPAHPRPWAWRTAGPRRGAAARRLGAAAPPERHVPSRFELVNVFPPREHNIKTFTECQRIPGREANRGARAPVTQLARVRCR